MTQFNPARTAARTLDELRAEQAAAKVARDVARKAWRAVPMDDIEGMQTADRTMRAAERVAQRAGARVLTVLQAAK